MILMYFFLAVKISPNYSSPCIHVLDASKSVVVVGSLLDKDVANNKDFVDDIKEQYEEERKAYLETQKERKYVDLAKARENKFVIDFKVKNLVQFFSHVEFLGFTDIFSQTNPPVKPKTPIGTPIVLDDYPLDKLVAGIDWNPFFQVWRLRGKYPNRNYPKLFNDPTVGKYIFTQNADE